jgi:hypothetical protein
MKQKNRYKNELFKLKKMLNNLHNKKLYNYVMLKIKKRKYNDIKYLFDLGDIFYSIIILETYDKKYILLNNYQERKEYLYKNTFFEKIKLFRSDLKKEEIKYLLNEMRFENIKKFINNYDLFIKYFIEIDKEFEGNIPDWIFTIKLDRRIISINNLMGLGLYIRNKYIHNNKIDKTLKEIDRDPDSLSGIILKGYRYYKIGIFEIFKKQ